MPKAFISSTCHDMSSLREALPKFLKELGWEPIFSESETFTMGRNKYMDSHDVCLAKVEELDKECDIYILVIGGRYGGWYKAPTNSSYPNLLKERWEEYLEKLKGSSSKKINAYDQERNNIKVNKLSITWAETIMAYQTGIYVLPFVDDKVWNERPTYKNNPGVTPYHAKCREIFHFIDYVMFHDYKNNWCESFNNSSDLKRKIKAKLSVVPRRRIEQIEKCFSYTFSDYPEVFFKDGIFDLAVIFSRGERESKSISDDRDKRLLNHREVNTEILGRDYSFQRIFRSGASQDAQRIGDLVAFLVKSFMEKNGKITDEFIKGLLDQPICYMDINFPGHVLEKNLIVIGGGDTNLFKCFVSIAFQEKYKHPIPVRFVGDDKERFTSEHIFSVLSGKVYQEHDETGFLHCGYLAMIPNPWNEKKVVILAAGNTCTGTQAALLALVALKDDKWSSSPKLERWWRSLRGNNRYAKLIPAKIVRATKARVMPHGEYAVQPEEEIDFLYRRIPGRYFITNFEFLE